MLDAPETDAADPRDLGSPLRPAAGTVSQMFETIPIAERTIAAMWAQALDGDRSRVFITFEDGRPWSYDDLDAMVARWRATFADLGVGPGDRLALLLPNCVEYVAAFFAAGTSGAIMVPLNGNTLGRSLEYALADSKAKALVTTTELAERFDAAWELPELGAVVLIDAETDQAGTSPAVIGFAGRTGAAPAITPAPTDVAAILYTSGTTGPPKGAVVTQEYYRFCAWSYAYYFGYTPDDVLFTVLPMFHANAQCSTLLAALVAGAQVAMHRKFSASRFWQEIHDTGATHFAAMGTMGNILMRRPASEFVPGHRLRTCQIVPAPEPLDAFEQRFGVPVLYEMFGMTEGGFLLASHRPGFGSGRMGDNTPYHDVRIHDADGREVPRGAVGEIVVRPHLPGLMFREYWNNPAATAEATRDLWFHTGDLGRQDDEGSYWYEGRLKDVIRRKGENIAPHEIERELLAHPAVKDVAAIGVPSELGEEEVMAFVATGTGPRPAAEELHAWCEIGRAHV